MPGIYELIACVMTEDLVDQMTQMFDGKSIAELHAEIKWTAGLIKITVGLLLVPKVTDLFALKNIEIRKTFKFCVDFHLLKDQITKKHDR